ncbi:hypothetical protein Vafri_5666, partial [Volvox africanus]
MTGLRAVTSISDSCSRRLMRRSSTRSPTTKCAVNDAAASPISATDRNTAAAISGLQVFSSNWPPAAPPATVTAVWLPMICAQTMIRASTCVGLTCHIQEQHEGGRRRASGWRCILATYPGTEERCTGGQTVAKMELEGRASGRVAEGCRGKCSIRRPSATSAAADMMARPISG